MAVFTEVPFADAAELLGRLGAGALTELRGIPSGIENTNYFADSNRGRYVITLFERLRRAQLPFYVQLMRHLAQRGIPVPDPLADANGELLHELSGKPALVAPRLAGEPALDPSAEQCESVARMLAQMHLAGRDFPGVQPNLRGVGWWTQTVPALCSHVTSAQRRLLESELSFQQQLARAPSYTALPRGPIHADLFRDNVLFDGHTLSGMLDFYFAAVDTFAFDIAVCLNDWCIDLTTGALLHDRAERFVAAYRAARALSADECTLMPALLRGAALRFWISRLLDLHVPRDAALLQPRDPTHFERVLRCRLAQPYTPQ